MSGLSFGGDDRWWRVCALATVTALFVSFSLPAAGLPFAPESYGIGQSTAVAYARDHLFTLSTYEDGKSGVRAADLYTWQAGGLVWETAAQPGDALANLRFLTVTAHPDLNSGESQQRMFMGAGPGFSMQIFSTPAAPRGTVTLGNGWLQQVVSIHDSNNPLCDMAASPKFLFFTVCYLNDGTQALSHMLIYNIDTQTTNRVGGTPLPYRFLDNGPSMGMNGLLLLSRSASRTRSSSSPQQVTVQQQPNPQRRSRSSCSGSCAHCCHNSRIVRQACDLVGQLARSHTADTAAH